MAQPATLDLITADRCYAPRLMGDLADQGRARGNHMYDDGWGLPAWAMVFLGFFLGPAVAAFVADSVVTAHDWASYVGGLVFLAMMALWLASLFYLNDAVFDRQRRRFEERQERRQRGQN